MKVYIGHDERERRAYAIAERSFVKQAWGYGKALDGTIPTALISDRLAACGLLRRMTDRRGQVYDLPSNAPCATDFAISRFLTPILSQTGWALFVDCDVVFLSDPADLLDIVDSNKAVMVVKHQNGHSAGTKMDGQAQVLYPRKNWSSVMLFNCEHPANRRLSLQDINERPGRDLHAFYWLSDEEIGELPAEWNWLVGVQEKPATPKIAHFTLGGPWLPNWEGAEHDDIWLEASR